jgi:hypothetical protein
VNKVRKQGKLHAVSKNRKKDKVLTACKIEDRTSGVNKKRKESKRSVKIEKGKRNLLRNVSWGPIHSP